MMRGSSTRALLAYFAVALCVAVSFVNRTARAGHDEPKAAKKYAAELVTPYAPCIDSNDTTPNVGIPACSPVQRLDTTCGLDPAFGRGKLVAKVSGSDIKLKGTVNHLTIGCEGTVLTLVATSRLTTDNCDSGGSCTTSDFPLPIGSCVVTDGRCTIRTTVNTVLPGALTEGNNAGIEVLGCNLTRITGPDAPSQTLACGLLVK